MAAEATVAVVVEVRMVVAVRSAAATMAAGAMVVASMVEATEPNAGACRAVAAKEG